MEKEKFNQLFCFVGMIDKKDGTIYVDNTGNFPITSIDGMKAVFILYDWTSNAILATPIATATDEQMIKAFKENINYLTSRGFKPSFNIIDNVASKAIKEYLVNKGIEMQLVEPNNHRANAAERAIQIFKIHFYCRAQYRGQGFPHHLVVQTHQTGTRLTQYPTNVTSAPKNIGKTLFGRST